MTQFFKRQHNKLNAFLIQKHIELMDKTIEYTKHPFQRRLMLTSAAITTIGLTMASSAYADGDGIAGMVSKGTSQALSIKDNLLKIFGAAGLGLGGYGGYNWWRKGKEGERSEIKAGQIFGPLFGGIALASTAFLMVKSGETIGINQSNIGVIP